jgi:hypothetical protein
MQERRKGSDRALDGREGGGEWYDDEEAGFKE